MIEEIKKEIIKGGYDLDDFIIDISKNGYSYYPRRNLDIRKVAKEEDTKLGIELSEREIREIIQGQQISDLEIQLLELQIGGM